MSRAPGVEGLVRSQKKSSGRMLSTSGNPDPDWEPAHQAWATSCTAYRHFNSRLLVLVNYSFSERFRMSIGDEVKKQDSCFSPCPETAMSRVRLSAGRPAAPQPGDLVGCPAGC